MKRKTEIVAEAAQLVSALLEAEDLDWEPDPSDPDDHGPAGLRNAVDAAAQELERWADMEWQIGFTISTGSTDLIEDNLRELGIAATPELWTQLNNDLRQLSNNVYTLCGGLQIAVRDEGHFGNDSVGGTAWVWWKHPEGLAVVKQVWEYGEPYSTSSGTIYGLKGFDHQHLYAGVSETGQLVLDVDLSFFAMEELAKDLDW